MNRDKGNKSIRIRKIHNNILSRYLLRSLELQNEGKYAHAILVVESLETLMVAFEPVTTLP